MTKELFLAICTELGMSVSEAERGWDRHPEVCKALTPAQVKKVACITKAVEQYARGEKITVPGIVADEVDGMTFMQYNAQET